VLQCVAMRNSVLQHAVMFCRDLHKVPNDLIHKGVGREECCSVLQCVAVCCSVLQCAAVLQHAAVCCREWQKVPNDLIHQVVGREAYCTVLQCVAACCSVLQCAAVCCRKYLTTLSIKE